MPSDEELERLLQTHPALKHFSAAVSQKLPAQLSKATRLARETRALAAKANQPGKRG